MKDLVNEKDTGEIQKIRAKLTYGAKLKYGYVQMLEGLPCLKIASATPIEVEELLDVSPLE